MVPNHEDLGGTGVPPALKSLDACANFLVGLGLSTDMLPIFEELFGELFEINEIFPPAIPQLPGDFGLLASNE